MSVRCAEVLVKSQALASNLRIHSQNDDVF